MVYHHKSPRLSQRTTQHYTFYPLKESWVIHSTNQRLLYSSLPAFSVITHALQKPMEMDPSQDNSDFTCNVEDNN